MKKYFSYKNGFTDELPNLNETDYLKIQVCKDTQEEVIVLYYFDMEIEEPLCLHSEDEENTKKSVELFKNEDVLFVSYLEFFTEDNVPRLIQILNM